MRPLLAIITVLALAVGVQGQQDPITNGGFEDLAPDGRPVDWEILGDSRVQTGDAHSGQRALRLVRRPDTPGETGLNRRWAPSNGRQGAMLAERKGGIRFWYKAAAGASHDLTVQVIPMNDKPLEVGGGRAVWRVPAQHAGDGEWHPGALAYDFTRNGDVKWVHVGARLGGKRAELWLDDFEWVDSIGPVLQVEDLSLAEIEGREGETGRLTLSIINVGDRPLPAGQASVQLPEGLSTPAPRAALPEVSPGKKAEVAWVVSGRRRAGQQVVATAEAAGQTAGQTLVLGARMELVGLLADRMILTPGRPTRVRLLARNAGTAIARGARVTLQAPAGLTVTRLAQGSEVRPGLEGALGTWRVTAKRPTPLASLRARASGLAGEATVRLVVAGRLPGNPPSIATPAYAQVAGRQAVIGSDRTRLVLARGAAGFGIGALQVRSAKGWRTVGMLPRLGLLATARGESVLTAARASAVMHKDGRELLLEGAARAGGTTWRLRWTLAARPHGEGIRYTMAATPQGAASILALEGPMLYAGEGSGITREDAIVPGMEWLVRGEGSSNALDFTPDHPDRVRTVPHPYKVTVPAVGMRFGDVAVGLLWDVPAQQPSFRQAGPASLVFSSPNRLEGHRNHLMGLFLPSVGKWVPENQRRSAKPFPVAAGRTLALRAELVAIPGTRDALVVQDAWYARHGFPEPLPYPRKSVRAEVAFSLRAYFKDRALWNPQWKRWYSDLIVGFQPTDGPAHDLLRGAEYLKTGPVADQARALAAEVLGGDERSRGLRLQHRASPAALREWAGRVRRLMASQHADGTWRFGGDKAGAWPRKGANYKVLGPEGASEVGLTAPNASDVLEFALATGDVEARAAGLKALQAMRQFRVPRAAQVWEVPVHTPDIYASARAVDAYLAGYRLTGDRRLLADAVYWAKTGLPFVYVWHPADQPAMHGATIPVFGGTSYVLSWLGVAVQWNGLGYSQSLLRLAEHDRSFPWKRVAEAILRSAMYQQATRGERLGQWPDAMNFIRGRKGLHGQTPPCFQPATILDQTFQLVGWKTAPATTAVRRGKEQLALRGMARFAGASWVGDRLRFTAAFTPPQAGAVEVIGTAKPRGVLLDGVSLPERDDVWQGDAPGWHWHEGAADLEIRLTRPGKHSVEVLGAERAPVVLALPLRREIDFRFDRGDEGWAAAHDLTPLAVADGRLETVTTGADPYMVRDSLLVVGKPGDVLVLRLSADGGAGGGSVFWGTEAAPGLAPARELSFGFAPDGSMQEMRVPVGEHEGWAGQTINTLRIDPGGGAPNVPVRIESIRLEPGQ